ncbi:MAG: T9SS type A sorting domain-containing protein [Bacteroidetes bacterium]|nr:T9SS type A sorting domain-containing protein [Bacteroidota bacterium]
MKKPLILSGIILFALPVLAQNRFYVDPSATSGNQYGNSWANAFLSIEEAFSNTSNGDSVWIKSGTYVPDGDAPSSTFNLVNGLKLYGGFKGDESSLTERDLTKNKTILSGDVGKANIDNDNCRKVLNASNLSSQTLLDGFVIQDGYSYDVSSSSVYGGGALRIDNSKLLFKNCVFRDNYSYKRGGALYVTGSSVLTFENVDFINNTCGDNTASSGGAMYCAATKITFTNCNFSGNTAHFGGAITSGGTTIEMDRCSFTGNNANLYYGGALNISSSSDVKIYNSLFIGNYAELKGSVIQSTFFDYCSFINCTIVGNATNSDNADDEAMHIEYNSALYNCIIWDNKTTSGKAIYEGPSANLSPVIDHCIMEGGYLWGSNTDTTSPKLINPKSSGDAPFEDNFSNYYLTFSSPAVNAGLNSYLPSKYSASDLNDSSRIISGKVDLGAFESPFESYRVRIESSDSVGGSVAGSNRYMKDSIAKISVHINSDCYTFDHWEEADTIFSYDTMFSIPVQFDRSFKAVIKQKEFTVSVEANISNAGTFSGGGKYPCDEGVKRTITANPGSCYSFIEWRMNGIQYATTKSISLEVTSDIQLVAVFEIKTFPILTGVKSGLGSVSGSGDYNCDSTVQLGATPSPGYKFEAWWKGTTILSANPNYSFKASESTTLNASFIRDLGVSNISETRINIFPNPGNGYLTINTHDFSEGKIQVFDVLGNHISDVQIVSNSADLRNFPDDIYLICISERNRISYFKYVKISN